MFTAAMMALLVCASAAIKISPDELNRTAAVFDAAMSEHFARPATSCSADFRSRMPACKQQGADWCWATGLAEMSFYYNKSTGGASNCTAAECAVVSMDHKMDCCPDGSPRCGGDSGSVASIVKDATEFMGIPFKSLDGPPGEAQLIDLLQAGKPVMPIITWYKAGRPIGGHALMVSGCTAGGPFGGVQYYLHDPEGTKYDTVGYGRLMYYSAFSTGKWTDTVVAA